jgi:hypothetical protein
MSKRRTTIQPTDRTGRDSFSRTRQKLQTISLMQHFGLDGYSNPASKIGMASPLMASGTFIRSNLSAEEMSTAYAENWLARRIIDTPAEDATRAWYSISSPTTQEQLRDLRWLEAQYSIRQKLTDAIRWARLYGGSIAVMNILLDDYVLDQPLDPNKLFTFCFQGLTVFDRTQVEPSQELVCDFSDRDFGLPKYYTVYIEDEDGGSRPVRIHHSRVLRFTGRFLPRREMEREEYWGASELVHIWDPLQRLSATAANIAELVNRANLLCLKSNDITEMLAAGTDEHTESVLKLMETENHFRTSYGLQLLSANDSMENLKYDFSGLPQVFEMQMLEVTGAAEIPATKLFGRSPEGMNATGESDMRNYYEMISAIQEKDLRPALERLLPVMAMSSWGFIPDGLEFLFEPLMTLSTEDQIRQAKEHAELLVLLLQAGVISKEEVREDLAEWSGRHGVLTNLKLKEEIQNED